MDKEMAKELEISKQKAIKRLKQQADDLGYRIVEK